jgi:hypothetical protein
MPQRIFDSYVAARKVKMGKSVFVAPSNFHGKGIFAAKDFKKGDKVCDFVGYPNVKPTELASRYMICNSENVCVCPTDLEGKRLLNTTPDKSGHLSNEAGQKVVHGVRRCFEPNAVVVPESDALDKHGLRHWPLRAKVDIREGSEILICYGHLYRRIGYTQSCACGGHSRHPNCASPRYHRPMRGPSLQNLPYTSRRQSHRGHGAFSSR